MNPRCAMRAPPPTWSATLPSTRCGCAQHPGAAQHHAKACVTFGQATRCASADAGDATGVGGGHGYETTLVVGRDFLATPVADRNSPHLRYHRHARREAPRPGDVVLRSPGQLELHACARCGWLRRQPRSHDCRAEWQHWGCGHDLAVRDDASHRPTHAASRGSEYVDLVQIAFHGWRRRPSLLRIRWPNRVTRRAIDLDSFRAGNTQPARRWQNYTTAPHPELGDLAAGRVGHTHAIVWTHGRALRGPLRRSATLRDAPLPRYTPPPPTPSARS